MNFFKLSALLMVSSLQATAEQLPVIQEPESQQEAPEVVAEEVLLITPGQTVFLDNDSFKRYSLIKGDVTGVCVLQLTENVVVEHKIKIENVTISGRLEVRGVPTGEKFSLTTKGERHLDLVGSTLKNCKVANLKN